MKECTLDFDSMEFITDHFFDWVRRGHELLT